MESLPQVGKVEWIGIRAERRADVEPVSEITVDVEAGLSGDHYSRNGGKRQITLVQAEHIEAVEKMLARSVDPGALRRNIVISGINILAFTDRKFTLGEVVLEMTGLCYPCSRIEENVGPGAYNAMRGHGGITAKVIKGGTLRVGDEVRLYQEPEAVEVS
ncbi:MOSC domain-containing protein [Flavilitoribacter nigricans]|uniref:MOSC domain-containing protein n=1 Tax=Flavilitoribacter nigricans TaxID=70997 RepID=UPI001F36716C|nr:MOSC domain-containing protein [Flavilitoribacter nigricans]